MVLQADILLVAINARYGHSAFAARCLIANLGPLAARAAIVETDTDIQPLQLVRDLLARQPRIIGCSAYLWNVNVLRETLAIVRQVAPEVRTIVGGPEIVPGCSGDWRGLADVLVSGEGESTFRRTCEAFLTGAPARSEEPRLVEAPPESPDELTLPYSRYDEQDIAHRTIYVESARGCPFACAYCTSFRTGLRLFPLSRLLPECDRLLERGVRAFRFLDRSFNAPEEHACALLDFFLTRHPQRLSLHFEIMPGRLGEALRRRLEAFPSGVLHLEVGVQTLNDEVAKRIGRTGDTDSIVETLDFLAHRTGACIHADLILGLPGETEQSLADGFDRLVRGCNPPELQVNLLKGLPGTPLIRRPAFQALMFNPHPPYELLRSDVLSFADLGRLQQFARCWDLVHNRGRFPRASARLIGETGSPFQRFKALSERIVSAEGRLHALGLDRLAGHLARFLASDCGIAPAAADAVVAADRRS